MNFMQKMKSKDLLKVYKGLPKASYIIALSSLINSMGNFVYPFLTLFLTKFYNYDEEDAGLFLLLGSVIYIPGALIAGKIADKFGRKKLLILSQIGVTTCFLGCFFLGLAKEVPYLFLGFLFFDGFADPVRSAIASDVTTPKNRQSSFALSYLCYNVGYSVGPILAGFLFYRSPTMLFLINAVMNAISGILYIFFIPESKPTEQQINAASGTTEKKAEGNLLKALWSRKRLLCFIATLSFITFGYSQFAFALPLYTDSLYGLKGPELYGILMAINGIVVVASNAIIVLAFKKFHPLVNVVISTLFFAVGFGLYAITSNFTILCVLTVVWTLGEVIEATNSGYYIANNTPITHRARFNSIVPLVQNTGRALGPYIGGMIIFRAGMQTLWFVAAACFLFAGLCVGGVYVTEQRGQTSKMHK